MELYNMFKPQQQQPTGYTNMDQSRWIQLNQESQAPAQQWADNTKNNLGITDPNTQKEPITPPYEVGAKTPTEATQNAFQNTRQTTTSRMSHPFNGNPNSPTDGMDYLASLYTSPEQEEKIRKSSVANQRIMAVADALRHIGNIYNTVNYAPAQQLNSPVAESTQRYLQGRALRDAANQRYFSYQQAKAAQDAKQRQWEQQFNYNLEKDRRDYALKKNESDARANLNEAKIQRYNTLMELDQARREGVISDNEWRKRRAELYPVLTQSQIAKNNRTGGGKGGSRTAGGTKGMDEYTTTTETTYNYDNLGKRTGTTTTKRRTVNGKAQPTQKKSTGGIKWAGSSTQATKREKKSVGVKWQ